jgi:hypothetical protein
MRLSSVAGLGLIATLLLTGCEGGEADKAPNTANAANAAAPVSNMATPVPEATGAPAGNKVVSFEEGKIDFRYSWPTEAAAIPELDGWLAGNAESLKKKTVDGGRNERASAKKDDYVFNGYSYSEDWHVAADVPSLLIMQSDGYSYTGGAHGMPIVTALFWDKAKKQRLATGAIFDLPALTAGIKDRFCKALDDERGERRGAPVKADDPDELPDFVQCVDITKQTILPVSLNGKALDTLRIVIMPYEAGPYAEGIYEIDLPVDAAVLKAVKPAYAAAFSAG